jgi:ribosomal protein L11 methyltransferase
MTSASDNASPSGQRKVVIEIDERHAARTIAGALTDLLMPAPDALTLFERGAAEKGAAWRIEAYYDPMPDLARLASDLDLACGMNAPQMRIEDVPLENWVRLSQAALPPVVAGRFTIHGSHDRHRVPRGPNSILIDAGEAFGTAHHATTQGCLAAIDRASRRRRFARVLDLGCGSGVLAIAVARIAPRARVLASDLDRQSVIVARGNMQANGVGSRITAVVAAGLRHPLLRGSAPYDLLIANILAAPLIMLSKSIAAAVEPDGTLILSGLLTPQAALVTAAYRAAGFHLVRHDRLHGWSTLTLARR